MARSFAVAVIILASSTVHAADVSGSSRPIDGDSLMVGTVEVRLHGIDAPELSQTCTRGGTTWACGSAATEQLTKLIAGQPVNCVPTGQDKHGRTLARCRAGGTDLNRTMVATGFALAYRRYSMDYIAAEESAKVAKRGIWAGTFEPPSEIRHAGDDYVVKQPKDDEPGRPVVSSIGSNSQPRSTRPPSSGGCRIKGNRTRAGEPVYHLPGMPYYERTVAEQTFCTEAEARAAGYRRSRADRHR